VLGSDSASRESRPSVAVVGGGIAGVGAAWALRRSGYPVTLFEKSPALGGNARTFRWQLEDGHVDSPLLVIAWPSQYYHNYHALLAELDIEKTTLPIAYYVVHPDGVFCQDGVSALDRRFTRDFERWGRLIRAATRINAFFLAGRRFPSMYDFSYLNPLNVLPLYRVARLFGISDEFWHKIFVPVHCATLITTSMKDLPAVVAPLMESIVPLDRPGEMSTWAAAPSQVFDRMTDGFRDAVHTDCEIVSLRSQGSGFALQSAGGDRFEAERVIFACQATAALRALDEPTRLEGRLLSRVQYVDDLDATFSRGRVHSDVEIFPEKDRDRILSGFNTYVEVDEAGRLECTFVLSAGNPNLRRLGRPMLVTFNSKKEIRGVEAELELPNSNPTLSLRNLSNMLLLRLIQGHRGLYFCGSYTTPEGAHDLSFLSGLVASRMVGADYPFDPANRPALADYHQMQRIMMGRVLPDRPSDS
jgi:predicted NAD/FAD-binding protein